MVSGGLAQLIVRLLTVFVCVPVAVLVHLRGLDEVMDSKKSQRISYGLTLWPLQIETDFVLYLAESKERDSTRLTGVAAAF